MLYFTNAPEAYDYGYCETVGMLHGMDGWRLIRVSDEDRFFTFQVPRYMSGLYQAVAPYSDDAGYFNLPPVGTPAEQCNAICGPNDCKGGCHA